MCIIMRMNSRDIIRAIEQEGWRHVGTTGSHWHYKHPAKPGKVTVPHPKKDIPAGTLRSIERQAGIKLR
jgi:predicted RNA binding protein YcfA (HicA-like mRNA interferase family)